MRMPESGVPYRPERHPDIRRLLMPKSRYHLYYHFDVANRLVAIRAVWHTSRGRGLTL